MLAEPSEHLDFNAAQAEWTVEESAEEEQHGPATWRTACRLAMVGASLGAMTTTMVLTWCRAPAASVGALPVPASFASITGTSPRWSVAAWEHADARQAAAAREETLAMLARCERDWAARLEPLLDEAAALDVQADSLAAAWCVESNDLGRAIRQTASSVQRPGSGPQIPSTLRRHGQERITSLSGRLDALNDREAAKVRSLRAQSSALRAQAAFLQSKRDQAMARLTARLVSPVIADEKATPNASIGDLAPVASEVAGLAPDAAWLPRQRAAVILARLDTASSAWAIDDAITEGSRLHASAAD